MATLAAEAIPAAVSIIGSLIGNVGAKNQQKSAASANINQVTQTIYGSIIPAYQSGQLSKADALLQIQQQVAGYIQYLNANVSNTKIRQQSIDTQIPKIQADVTKVFGEGSSVYSANVPTSAEAGMSTAASSLLASGADYTKMGKGALTQSGDYYSKILGGGQGLAEATATSAADLQKQYQTGLQSLVKSGGRSGASATAAANAPFSLASSANALRFGAQSTAAQQLASLGSTEAGLGLQGTGAAGSLYGAIGGHNVDLSKLGLAQQQQSQSSSSALGSSIGKTLSSILSGLKGSSGLSGTSNLDLTS